MVVPSNAYDAKGLMAEAIADDNPVVFMFHKGQMGLLWMSYYEGATVPVPEAPYRLSFGQAGGDTARDGPDPGHDQPDGA